MREPQGGTGRLTIGHMLGVLVGRGESIRIAAQDRATIWVGAVIVAAAGLAREYDGEYLVREPWHLLIPFAASLLLSLTLFSAVDGGIPNVQPFWRRYRAFLGVFWMTAPMALLYAIPYERFLAPADAVSTNLWTLGLVSVWRGLVTTHAVSIFTGRSFTASFFLAACVADLFAAAALAVVPLPTIQFMGGIRLTDAERTIQSVGFFARIMTFIGVPVLLIIVGFIGAIEKRRMMKSLTLPPSPHRGLPVGPIAVAVAMLIGMTSLLPFTQPEQRLRWDAERLLRNDELPQAIAEMSRHARSDYPPMWDPPPRIGWPEPEKPELLTMLDVVIDHGAAEWVRGVYIDKFARRYLSGSLYYDGWDQWPIVLRTLDRLPEGPQLREQYADEIARVESRMSETAESTTKPTTTRSAP